MRKITIVGAGRVGETTAQILAEEELCRRLPSTTSVRTCPRASPWTSVRRPVFRVRLCLSGSNDPHIMRGSEMLVITAGLPRKPGMSRSDVLEANVRVIDEVVDQAKRYAPTR